MNIAGMTAHQARVFVDFPTEPVIIGGTTYNALVMDRTHGNDYGEGGLLDTPNIRLAIERGAIGSAIPVQGTQATFDGGTYRIAGVEQDDAASSIVITLENLTVR